MNDREMKVAGIVAGAGLLGVLVVNGAYQAGVRAGLAQSGNPAAVAHHGDGFFPFPLLLIVGAVLFIGWRKRWFNGNGPGGSGRGPGGGPPRIFEEWHRRAHEAETPAVTTEGGRSNGGTSESSRPEGGPTESKTI